MSSRLWRETLTSQVDHHSPRFISHGADEINAAMPLCYISLSMQTSASLALFGALKRSR